MQDRNRRALLKMGALTTLSAALPLSLTAKDYLPDSVRAVNKSFGGDKGDQLDPALVQDFVRRSHFDPAGIKKLTESYPQLVYASWDWGGGDFETGLGAASHVGNRDIALDLLARGARPNIFSAAMLGQLDVVQALLTAAPDLIDCRGPHGLTLVHHARKGGQQAIDVLAYLERLDSDR